MIGWNTLEVLSLAAGNPHLPVNAIPDDLMRKYLILPIGSDNGKLRVAIHDPLDLEMLDILRGQFYDSRLPRFIKEQALVAHKTGEAPPYVINDTGIIFHEGGPTVVTVFVNQNQGTVLEVEEVIGQIAKDLVSAWGTRRD